jgi:tetratricopeptide (TPR) repeat protein
MRWQQTEFILKGVYLGLLVFVALLGPNWRDIGLVALCTVGGFLLFMLVGAARKMREGYLPRGRKIAFTLFLLLENPWFVYTGILLGLTVGAYLVAYVYTGGRMAPDRWLLVGSVGGGIALGFVFWYLRLVKSKKMRLYLGLALVVALVGGVIYLLQEKPDLLSTRQQHMFGVLLLLGIPLFYLMTFASLVEESEVEIAAICAALGVGLWLVVVDENGRKMVSDYSRWMSLIIIFLVYVIYTRYFLPGLRVFKHVLRGMGYAAAGRFRGALISLGRAMQLDPKNELARRQLWHVHRVMDFDEVVKDPDTLALVNFELCLDRASSLLMNPPTPERLHESSRLLNLIGSQRPEMLPRANYWKAVAALHEKNHDEAAGHLEVVLTGADSAPENPHRWWILYQAWELALTHPQMKEKVGVPQLQDSLRRMEAIAAVERRLTKDPKDESARELKERLYRDLHEEDYNAVTDPGEAAEMFDHKYVKELGLAAIADANRWGQGNEFLRIASRGTPENAPSLLVKIAQTCEKYGDVDGAWEAYEHAKRAGVLIGPKKLSQQDQEMYFQVVKMLAETAMSENQVDKALANFRLYTESNRAGIETYRALAELYERKGDSWAALHSTEHGLTYNSADSDLLKRKDKYYYSITPAELKERMEAVQKWFDLSYCLRKARWLLDKQGGDMEIIDWASHLLELAQVYQPGNITVRVLRGRIERLRGNLDKALELFEEVRTNRPEKFPSSDEEESWYQACRILGDLYLSSNAEKALECLSLYKQHSKSGADTLYKMGVAYEALGDHARAVRCYEQVVVFDNHPRAYEAREALRRLKTPSASGR